MNKKYVRVPIQFIFYPAIYFEDETIKGIQRVRSFNFLALTDWENAEIYDNKDFAERQDLCEHFINGNVIYL